MENIKKNIISDDELNLISGGVIGRPRRPQTTQDNWSMPEDYAINGVTYQEAVIKMKELAIVSPQSAINYANEVLFPHEGWRHIYSQGVESTTREMFNYHYRNN
jgi:DNA/RNA endonuclease G (NUC1)